MSTLTLPDPVTTEFERTIRDPKGSRSIKTEWILSTTQVTPEVTEEIVVRLVTNHVGDRKAYRSFVARFKRTRTVGSAWFSEHHGSVMSNWNTVNQVPVARYSTKTIREAHAVALTVAALNGEIEAAAAQALADGGGPS